MAFSGLEEVLCRNHTMVRGVEALLANLDCFEESSIRAEDIVAAGLSAFAGLEVLTVCEQVLGRWALLEVLKEVEEFVRS